MVVIVLLVIILGVGSYGYVRGWLGSDEHPGTSAEPPCPTTTAALRADEVNVNVYNSTARNGLAAGVAKLLRGRGFAVANVANDPLHASIPGTALIRHGAQGLAAATLLAAQVPKATLVKDNRAGADVDLVLGRGFVALGPVPTATATPSPATTAPCRPAPTTPGTSATTSGAPTGTGG